MRHQEDLVAGAGEIELLLGSLLEVGDDRLAGRPEVDDGVADLLDLAPQRGGAGRPDDDAGDTLVDLGLPQRVDNRADGRPGFEDLPDHSAGLALLQIPAELHRQNGVAGDRRFTADQHGGEDETGRGNHYRDKNKCQHEPDTATYCHDLPPESTVPLSASAATDVTKPHYEYRTDRISAPGSSGSSTYHASCGEATLQLRQTV